MQDDAIRDAEAALGVALPGPLRSLYRDGDGRDLSDGEWWVVWPIARLVADTSAAWQDGTLHEELVAFGDDGTGNPFCVAIAEPAAKVFRWSWIDGAIESDMSWTQFVADWIDDDRH